MTPAELARSYGLDGEAHHVLIGQNTHVIRAGQRRTLCGRTPRVQAGLMAAFGAAEGLTTEGKVTCASCYALITPSGQGESAEAWMLRQQEGEAGVLVVDL